MVARRRWRAGCHERCRDDHERCCCGGKGMAKATGIVWAWLGAATVGTRTHVRGLSFRGVVQMSIPSSHMVAVARAQPLPVCEEEEETILPPFRATRPLSQ